MPDFYSPNPGGIPTRGGVFDEHQMVEHLDRLGIDLHGFDLDGIDPLTGLASHTDQGWLRGERARHVSLGILPPEEA